MRSFRWHSFNDWFDQARRTFASIENDFNGKDFNRACFKAQQAAAFGHSVSELGRRLASSIPDLVLDEHCLASLDKLYIPTRYADAFPGGPPYTFFTENDAREAETCARGVLDAIESHVNEHEVRPAGGEEDNA